MGSLGGVQGVVLGAASRVQNPFPADPLPSVCLGLVPAAVNLGREGTVVELRVTWRDMGCERGGDGLMVGLRGLLQP